MGTTAETMEKERERVRKEALEWSKPSGRGDRRRGQKCGQTAKGGNKYETAKLGKRKGRMTNTQRMATTRRNTHRKINE